MSGILNVLMPVHNAERYVAEAVNSILRQTYADFEFVIIDDGSTDRSHEILLSLAERDPRIRLVSRPNTGLLRALNEGLALCRRQLVARMDADDIALPDRFERQIDYLVAHPDCVAVGCSMLRIDADGDLLCEEPMPQTHETIEARLLQGYGALPHPSAMIRRQQLAEVGGYREAYLGAEDHDLWLRLAERGRLANLAEPLIKVRIHPENFRFVTETSSQKALAAAVTDAYRRRGLPCPDDPLFGHPPPLLGVDRARAWTRSAIYAGQYRTARKHACSIWRRRFWQVDSWVLLAHALLGPHATPVRKIYRRLRGRQS